MPRIRILRAGGGSSEVVPYRGWPLQPVALPADAVAIEAAGSGDGIEFATAGTATALWLLFRLHLGQGHVRHRLATGLRLLRRGRWTELARRLTRRSAAPDPVRLAQAPPRRARRRPDRLPVKAALVTHSLDLEGAPLSLHELARGLAATGVIVPHVFAPRPGPLAERYREAGVAVSLWRLPPSASLDADDYGRAVDALAGELDRLGSELVIANTLRSFYAIDAADLAGIPCLWIVRESDPWWSCFDELGEAVRQRAYACLGKADQLVFVAEATRRGWEAVLGPRPGRVIRNSLPPPAEGAASSREQARRHLGLADDALVVLCVGVLSEVKGQDVLIRALAALPDAVAGRLSVLLLGRVDDGFRPGLDAAMAGLDAGRKARLRIDGPCAQPAAYFAAADIYVLASRTESYPRVVLEAMSHGLAIVATPVFGVTEQLADGVTALFVAPADPTALAHQLARLATEPELRHALGRSARAAFAAMPDFDAMLAAHAEAIAAACGLASDQRPTGQFPAKDT